MLTIDATTPGYFGRNTTAHRATKTTLRMNNKNLLVQESNHSVLLHASAAIMTLSTLVYMGYEILLRVGVSFVG
jgi:hypothetical protein